MFITGISCFVPVAVMCRQYRVKRTDGTKPCEEPEGLEYDDQIARW